MSDSAQWPATPTYFFDASAIVKIFLDEPGSKAVRAIYAQPQRIHTSWILIAEAMGVFKRKWLKKQLTDRQYGAAVYNLFTLVHETRLHPVDLVVEDGHPRLGTFFDSDVIALRKKYPELDLADALQFKAIQAGVLGILAGDSAPQLVTGDHSLCCAARSEGLRVVFVGEDQ